jgi:hypothetical protein
MSDVYLSEDLYTDFSSKWLNYPIIMCAKTIYLSFYFWPLF